MTYPILLLVQLNIEIPHFQIMEGKLVAKRKLTHKEWEVAEMYLFTQHLVLQTKRLRDEKNPKMHKMTAFRSLLTSLEEIRGLSHLSTHIDIRQKDLTYLLSLPEMEAASTAFSRRYTPPFHFSLLPPAPHLFFFIPF